MFGDTAWDLFNVGLGATSAFMNFKEGNVRSGLVDTGGALVDLGAAFLPFIPGGAGSAIRGSRIAHGIGKVARRASTGSEVVDGGIDLTEGIEEGNAGKSVSGIIKASGSVLSFSIGTRLTTKADKLTDKVKNYASTKRISPMLEAEKTYNMARGLPFVVDSSTDVASNFISVPNDNTMTSTYSGQIRLQK